MPNPRISSLISPLLLSAAAVLLLAAGAHAQSGTVTDDAFLSSSPTTQILNLNGQGISLIVAGSSASVGSIRVGATTTYIKFQLLSSLPPNTPPANVAKATLKLYLSPLTLPSGAIDIYPITSAWTESTLSSSSPPSLAATPINSTPIVLGAANSFLVIDLTTQVQEWLTTGGPVNDGIALVPHTSTSYVVFDSKESVITSHEPRLELVLTDSGPQGPQGQTGPAGPAGAAGAAGTAATVQVGKTTTAPAGTFASVFNTGTPNAAVLSFLIPQGATGATGPQGNQGPQGIQGQAGPTGQTGAAGAQGLQGAPGPALPDLVYTDQNNTLTSNQTLLGNLTLGPTGAATAAQGFSSNPLDLAASVSDGTNAHNETFRWQSVPLNNGAANFGAQLNLLYGGGVTPTPTGFSANPDGSLNFVNDQVFTGKHVGDGSGLTNLPNTFVAGGDLTGGTTLQTVSRLQGVPLNITGTGNLALGSVLSYNGSSWIPSPGFSPGGDLSGTATAQTVSKLQGMPLSLSGTSAPPGSVLAFSGGAWVPTPGFQPGADLTGTATAQTVNKLQGIPLLTGGTGGPSAGQVLGFNGAGWAATTIPAGPAGPAGPQGPQGIVGPQGPPGLTPSGAAITSAANSFTTNQTISGNLILTGTGNGVTFPDGTTQTTAGAGGGAAVPSGFLILGTSPAPPPGYSLSSPLSGGNAWFGAASGLTSMPTARFGLAAAVVNGKIYAIGGANGGSDLNTVEVYDPSTNAWSVAASMPTARHFLAAAAVNGKIYAVGGQVDSIACACDLNTLEVYDPSTNIWSAAAPMLTARESLAVVALNGKIYALGGTLGGAEVSAVEVYDPSANTWTAAAPLTTATTGLAAATLNGKIYAVGGATLAGTTGSVASYDPSTNTWTTEASMPTARYDLSAAALNGRVYAIGGLPSGFNTVEVYDPTTNAWGTAPSMPTGRWALAAVDTNGVIYAIGGVVGLGGANSVEQYLPPVTLYTFTKN